MLSIIIPVLNEEEGLAELKRRVSSALEAVAEPYEVIAVNDGSTDGSLAALRSIHERDGRWRIVDLSRNFGHAGACTAGLEYARGEAVVFLDADLQDPPELIADFVAKWREGFEVVYGHRVERKEGRVRKVLSGGFYRILGFLSDTSFPAGAGIFSLIDRRVAQELKALPERHRYLAGLRGWVGFKQAAISYQRDRRKAATPRQTYSKLFGLAADALFSFSIVPLRLATLLGAGVSCAAFVAGLRILYLRIFTNKPIVGWTSIMLAVLGMGGMILVTLGIAGEYIGRIYDEVKHRPLFIVKETIGIGSAER